MSLYVLRPGTEADHNFVLSSWIRSYRGNGSPWVPTEAHHRLIEAALKRDKLWVACGITDPSVIYGWACGNEEALHYVFVKLDFRSMKMARELIFRAAAPHPRWIDGVGENEALPVSHWTYAMRDWSRKGIKLEYNPWPFWSRDEIDRSSVKGNMRKAHAPRRQPLPSSQG